MSCKYTSDNFYKNSPCRMNDGRIFTDYRSTCVLNNLIQNNNSIKGSNEYKNFLVKNADNFRESYESYLEQKNTWPGYPESLVPERSMLKCDTNKCVVDVVDPNGIGQGRDFGVGDGCDKLEEVSNLRNRFNTFKSKEENCCGVNWQSDNGYPYIENNLVINSRGPIGGL
jgi:hypothetical protein